MLFYYRHSGDKKRHRRDARMGIPKAAIGQPVMYGDIAVPNPLITNMAKLHFASHYHEFLEMIQVICGGIISTMPTYSDWRNPDTYDYIEYYLRGNPKYTTEERLKMIHAAHRLVASAESAHHEIITVHAEGSMATQKMMILAEAPLKQYCDMAPASAGVEIKDRPDKGVVKNLKCGVKH